MKKQYVLNVIIMYRFTGNQTALVGSQIMAPKLQLSFSLILYIFRENKVGFSQYNYLQQVRKRESIRWEVNPGFLYVCSLFSSLFFYVSFSFISL